MTMFIYTIFSAICGFFFVAAYYQESGSDDVCFGRHNTVYARTCKTYIKCVNGTSTEVNCDKYMVFNTDTVKCEYVFNVHSPCGVFRDCSKLPDGHFPDTEQKCMRFYTCWKGNFLGFTDCTLGLVFNVRKQVCDWPFNVMPPCGIR